MVYSSKWSHFLEGQNVSTFGNYSCQGMFWKSINMGFSYPSDCYRVRKNIKIDERKNMLKEERCETGKGSKLRKVKCIS